MALSTELERSGGDILQNRLAVNVFLAFLTSPIESIQAMKSVWKSAFR